MNSHHFVLRILTGGLKLKFSRPVTHSVVAFFFTAPIFLVTGDPMLRAITTSFLILAAGTLSADEAADTSKTTPSEIIFPGDSVDLSEFVWKNRPLVVFADSPEDPRFIQQMAFLNQGLDDLRERDVIVLTDPNKDSGSALREKLHPRGFMLALIGKDGRIFLRKPLPWDVREITRAIDKMPTRQQEIRDRRGGS
ncbi:MULTISPECIES: DUF4174 domain-containing protein [Roseovarius]|uniref:DUF4174 domain-containing protein n=1 Tax=Roseovarius rhodophyticola TaxID=3080827 RepID=A0ABZ2TFC6_9RHOB|nr:DUF4174 domain-containing protein [Roseovarius sp. W115]